LEFFTKPYCLVNNELFKSRNFINLTSTTLSKIFDKSGKTPLVYNSSHLLGFHSWTEEQSLPFSYNSEPFTVWKTDWRWWTISIDFFSQEILKPSNPTEFVFLRSSTIWIICWQKYTIISRYNTTPIVDQVRSQSRSGCRKWWLMVSKISFLSTSNRLTLIKFTSFLSEATPSWITDLIPFQTCIGLHQLSQADC
jgi:hypothetical protein